MVKKDQLVSTVVNLIYECKDIEMLYLIQALLTQSK